MSKNTKNIFKLKSIKENLASSSIHGLPNIIKNKYKLFKVMWIVFFLVSLGVSVEFINRSIADFFDHSVTTKMLIQHRNKLIFPIVNICNLNFMSTDYSKEVSQMFFGSASPPLNLSQYAKVFANYVIKSKGYDKTLLGHSINEIFIQCQFNQINCDLYQDFDQFYDVNYVS